tara:strand:+ start:80 stop:964 length:885 start_codon:yes stop_codon:yes gene_type:complete
MLNRTNNPHYDFPIEMVNLKAIGNMGNNDVLPEVYKVPTDMARALVRTDTGDVLGIHGSKYKPISHKHVCDTIEQGVEKLCKKFDTNTDDIDYKVSVYDNGAKMRGSFLFNKQIIEPQVDDIIAFRINFFNSYDQSWAFQSIADGLRLWCLNGCTTPMTATSSRFKHTSNVSIEGVQQKMLNGYEYFKDQEGTFKMYADTQVQINEVEHFFKTVLCKTFTRSKTSMSFNNTQLELLLREYDKEIPKLGRTKWTVYNAMTSWATHVGNGDASHKTNKLREIEVSKALSTSQWETL